MKIALLIPSRERMSLKRDLVASIEATVDDINNVNLYFGIDDNDPTRDEVIKLAQEHRFIKIVDIHTDGKFPGLGVLWNIVLKATTEEIIAMIGDDMVFSSKSWDTKILEEFNDQNCPKDHIKMIYCYDGRHGWKMAVNAFIHREYTAITGYFMREEFKVDFIDLWLHQIFASLGRLKYRGDIHIDHRHWSFGKSMADNVVRNLRGNNYPAMSQKMWVDTFGERIKEAKKIAEVIGVDVDLSKINDRIIG